MIHLLITYVLTYGGAVVSLFNPFWGVLIYIWLSIANPMLLWAEDVPKGNYMRIVAIAFLVGWVCKGFGNRKLLSAKPICLAMIGYFAWTVLVPQAVPAIKSAWQAIDVQTRILLPFIVAVTLIDSVEKLNNWRGPSSVPRLHSSPWPTSTPIKATPGFAFPVSATSATTTTSPLPWSPRRASLFSSASRRRGSRKCLALAAAALLVHAVMFSNSRGGMLGLVVLGAASVLIIVKQRKHYGVLCLAFVAALLLAGPSVKARFSKILVPAENRDRSAESRLELWANAWDAMKKQPILGLGPGQWGEEAPSPVGQKGRPFIRSG